MVNINELRESLIEEDQPFSIGGSIGDVLRNFNTGLARTLGIPRAITDLNEQVGGTIFGNVGRREEGKDRFNILPTGEQLQELGAREGITFPPGEEPDTLAARTVQNIGAAAPILPFFGLTAPLIGFEALASFGAAGGGKLLQSTEFGQRHPELARAIGELGGGFGAVFTIPLARFLAKGGSIGAVFRFLKRLLPGTEKRVSKRLDDITTNPQAALRELEIAEGIPEGELLTTAQASGAGGLARLEKSVEDEIPKVAAILEKRRIQAINQLQKQFNKTGDIADARALLQEQLALRASQAEIAAMKISTISDPSILSTKVENILELALKEARKIETRMFGVVSKTVKVKGINIIDDFKEELRKITEGASKTRITPFLKAKLGILNKNGDLIGGTLFTETGKELKSTLFDQFGKPIPRFKEAKTGATIPAIQDFLQDINSEIRNLTFQRGKDNQIRILKKIKTAVFKDLDATEGGEKLTDAIAFSRELNRKFTRGAVGKILGRKSGETPLAVTSLEEIVGEGGVKTKENILQALAASPETKTQIQNFLKVRFAVIAKNETNNRINVNAGNAFIKKFDNILDDIFPELKRDFKDAIARQADVDEFIGVAQVSGLSPLIREKTAAGFFLGRDPGEEMAALLQSKTIRRTNFLTDLVKITRTDPTGKALKGLQNGFTEELLKIGNVDELTKLSGARMINKLNELQKSTLASGLFNKEEFNRLKSLANIFRKIEVTEGAKKLPGGIIDDPVSKLFALPLRWVAARLGGKTGGSLGGSLQIANQAVKESQAFARGLTNDEAQRTLIRFVLDKKLAKDLLTDVTKLSKTERGNLFFRISRKIDELTSKTIQGIKENIPRPPITAVAPAAGSIAAGISGERDLEEDEITRKLEALLK